MKIDATARIITAVEAVGHITAQNKLMGVNDRDLAIALERMSEDERHVIFANISRSKRQRVEEEIERQSHVNVTYAQYILSAEAIVATLLSKKPGYSTKSYLRPRRFREAL